MRSNENKTGVFTNITGWLFHQPALHAVVGGFTAIKFIGITTNLNAPTKTFA